MANDKVWGVGRAFAMRTIAPTGGDFDGREKETEGIDQLWVHSEAGGALREDAMRLMT